MKKFIWVFLLFMQSICYGENNNIEQSFIGTWRMIASITKELPSGKITYKSPTPNGYLIYTPNHHVIVLVIDEKRKSDPAQLINSMVGYVGTFKIQQNKVVHHVLSSWNETWTGKNLERTYKFENNHLRLILPPEKDAKSGKINILEAIWERS